MKDALGHGSDAHSDGVRGIGDTAFLSGVTAAGKYRIGTKPVESLTNGQLGKEYENLTLHQSATTRDLINTGRGQEKMQDIIKGKDDLSRTYAALNARVNALHYEHSYRSKMGGRRVTSEDGRTKFVGGVPPSLKHGYHP